MSGTQDCSTKNVVSLPHNPVTPLPISDPTPNKLLKANSSTKPKELPFLLTPLITKTMDLISYHDSEKVRDISPGRETDKEKRPWLGHIGGDSPRWPGQLLLPGVCPTPSLSILLS